MYACLNPFCFLVVSVAGWMNQHQQHVVEYLTEENRVLQEQTQVRRKLKQSLAPERGRVGNLRRHGVFTPYNPFSRLRSMGVVQFCPHPGGSHATPSCAAF